MTRDQSVAIGKHPASPWVTGFVAALVLSWLLAQALVRPLQAIHAALIQISGGDLGARVRALEAPTSPFVDARPIPRGTHWTRPELVAQIGFAEWTTDGRLRQPRFLGLRDDKAPAEVVRERAR